MSIADEISRLAAIKEDIIEAIEDGGGVVPPGSRYDDFAEIIDGLEVISEEDLASIIDRTAVTPKLPSSLTSIGSYAFYYCTSLALTELPAGLTSISDQAFYNCTSLALTELPMGLRSIGASAFINCAGLALTSLPSGLTSIGDYAFYYCTGLTAITFKGTPSGTISSSAFQGCNNLTTIRVPWSSGAKPNAPWGATNATIVYDYTG